MVESQSQAHISIHTHAFCRKKGKSFNKVYNQRLFHKLGHAEFRRGSRTGGN